MLPTKRRLLNVALESEHSGALDEAIPQFERYLQKAPDDVEARRRLAAILIAQGRVEEAIGHFERLVDHLMNAGLGLRAIATCCRILRLDPEHEGARRSLDRLSADRAVDPDRVLEASIHRDAQPPPLPDDEVADADDLLVAELNHEGDPAALSSLPLFSEVDPTDLESLVRALDLWTAPKGTEVIRQGDIGHSFFVVVQGVARVERTLPNGDTEWLTILREGDFFGESAALADLKRTTTVVGQTDLELLEIHRERLDALRGEHPSIERALRRWQRTRFIRNLMATDHFRAIDPRCRDDVLGLMRDRRCSRGARILSAGQPVKQIVFLLAGDLRAGERSLFEGARVGGAVGSEADVDVVAESDAHLLVLDAKNAERLKARHPSAFRALVSPPAP